MKSNKSNGQMTAQINVNDSQKSGFDLSCNNLGTGKIGRIIPTRALHVMPGDTIKQDTKVAVQFEPLAVPILANMEVKQEHFYVPYNVVWRNWDKFISGGEDLDYRGVVPNATLQRIFDLVSDILSAYIPTKMAEYEFENETIVTYNLINYIDRLDIIKEHIETIADDYSVKDILNYTSEVLSLLYNLSSNSDTLPFQGGESAVFIVVRGNTNPTFAETNFTTYLEYVGLSGNKYLEELRPAIVADMTTQDVLLPTAKGFVLMDYLYELVKPLIGIGSNIDYLNMGRLTLTEFIYNNILSFTNAYAHGVYDFEVGIDNAYVNNNPLSILNLRANYNIWYNNYRDILLEKDVLEPQDTDEILDEELFTILIPRQRCWEKDMFTTALDNPGTGAVGVPITRTDMLLERANKVYEGEVADLATLDDMEVAEISFRDKTWKVPTAFLSGQNPIQYDGNTELQGFSLHALDAAQRAQKWLQKALYFGNRISDFYYLRFGVRFLDARLRLPELLTSSTELVSLDVVINNTNITTEANGEVFQSVAGDRAAYASAYDNGNMFDRFCEEHGVIMSYLTIMPQVTYAHGVNRDYSRLDQFDYAFAEFATLGMDAVYDTEISSCSVGKNPKDMVGKVFGYQGRYYDYKAKHSEEHGELLDSQDMYTFSRKFNMFDPNGRPRLNYEFVHCFPPLDMFVVDSQLADYFRYDIRHSCAGERQLPSQSIYI